MTEFSPRVHLALQAAEEALSCARKYRRDRYWALPSTDGRPRLPEGAVWSDDEQGVRAVWASGGSVGLEQLEWPQNVEPQPVRRFRRQLATGAQGELTYEIRVYDPCDAVLEAQDVHRKARKRPRQVLPSNHPFLLVTFTTRPDLDALRCASTAMHPPKPHVPRRLTVVIGLGEKSTREQQRWRQRRRDDRKFWLTSFGEWERRGPTQRAEARQALVEHLKADSSQAEGYARAVGVHQQSPHYVQGERSAWRDLYVDTSTTPADLTAQLLAYLLQDEMVPWDEIAPWQQQYDRRPLDDGSRYQRLREFALPLQANALYPPSAGHAGPEAYSCPQAAQMLGITERQLRAILRQGKIPGIETQGRRVVIPPEALEQHLRSLVVDQARRQQDKPRRALFMEKAKNEYGMTSEAIRQMIHRGARTLQETPDWDVLDVHLTRRSRRAQGQETSETTVTADDLEGLRTLLEAQARMAQTEDESLDILDKLTYIRQRQKEDAS